MKFLKLFCCLIFTIVLFLSYSFAKTKTYCWYNRYGNYYCSYSDGSYEYWNKQVPWNPYYGLPYYYSNGSNNYNYNSINYWNTLSQDAQCNLKYPWTEYRSSDWWCACPWDAKWTSSWSSYTKSCKWQWDQLCTKKYWNYAESSSYDYNTCICKDWYERNSSRTSCIKRTASCSSYGPNAYLWTDNLCYCKNWYEWNSSMTYCVAKTASCSEYWPNSYLGTDNYCYCKDGYWWDTPSKTYCVIREQSCKWWYWNNSYAWTDNLCYCKNWYGWDSPSQNSCVAIEESCKWWFGKNSYAWTDNLCYCKDWYEWNGSMTSCVESAKTNVIQSYDWAMPHSFTDAYNFAFKNWITTMETMDKADMYWTLDRIAMAKMIWNYAINILWLTPDLTQSCYFSDVPEDVNIAYDNWVTKACQLWLMWQWIKKFMPFAKVTRAEFATVLSRLLNRDSDDLARLNSADPYYTEHMKYLEDNWIIDSYVNLGIFDSELRWNVMLMLMRANDFENAEETNCTAEELVLCTNSDDMDECIASCEWE